VNDKTSGIGAAVEVQRSAAGASTGSPSAKSSILETIGNTPVVRLGKLFAGSGLEVFAKLESLNPGGSIKDRPAYNIITRAMESGEITKDTTIVESSSGNFAIGLAQMCAYLGLRLVCVVDIKTTAQNVRIIEAYGARVDLVSEPDPITKEYLQARLKRVRQILASVPNSFWPNQYVNRNNSGSHFGTTMPEIVDLLGQDIDYVFLATSTCGTLRGCAEYLRERGMATRIVAVDAMGSVIFGRPSGKRLLPGHGAGIVPKLFAPDLADDVVHVSDLDCVVGCRRLVQHEAILAGASSGGIITAIERLVADEKLRRPARCVAILPDRGERYLDTVYSDSWVQSHFGEEDLPL
jgi:2,3-diaminopropionate biosynthesis protein SbnA